MQNSRPTTTEQGTQNSRPTTSEQGTQNSKPKTSEQGTQSEDASLKQLSELTEKCNDVQEIIQKQKAELKEKLIRH